LLWQSSSFKLGVDDPRQLGLTGPIVRQRQRLDLNLQAPFVTDFGAQCLESSGIGPAREQLVAVDQIEQRPTFPPLVTESICPHCNVIIPWQAGLSIPSLMQDRSTTDIPLATRGRTIQWVKIATRSRRVACFPGRSG
jgi:hypothetical protein